ncbi:MAG: hypothetical protein ACXV3C_00315 [Actinomycetes bacterium]
MGYVPPSGWVETRPTAEGEPVAARFHTRPDCPRLQGGELRQVDKPYSAARCPLCANEVADRAVRQPLTSRATR